MSDGVSLTNIEHPTKSYLLSVGDYMVWDVDDERFGITNRETGESGVYQKQEFLPYIEAFFGLNF